VILGACEDSKIVYVKVGEYLNSTPSLHVIRDNKLLEYLKGNSIFGKKNGLILEIPDLRDTLKHLIGEYSH